jgi:hypothetical protein
MGLTLNKTPFQKFNPSCSNQSWLLKKINLLAIGMVA